MKVETVTDMDWVAAEAARVATEKVRLKGKEKLSYGDPTRNELALFEIIREICIEHFSEDSVQHIGGHKFPDVVFPHARTGIEIKCHKNENGFILGNSIMGSTFSISQPRKIGLLVWTDSNRTVQYHDYFESVVGAEVTHSPRFRLKPEASESERLFGREADQVGEASSVCLGPDGIDSERILAHMRLKALKNGDVPWWMGDEKPSELNASLSISRFGSLSRDQKDVIETLGTFLFPEVLGRASQTKYDGVIAWGLVTRGVLMSRDSFSAGGKVTMALPKICRNHEFLLPKSFAKGMNRLGNPMEIDLSELRIYWNKPSLAARAVASQFGAILAKVDFSDVVRHVKESSCDRCSQSAQRIHLRLVETLLAEVKISVVD